MPPAKKHDWNITKIGAIVGIVVTLFSSMSGIYFYIDSQYISKHEMQNILLVMQTNNNELLSAFKTLGGSFYDSNIIELNNTIKILEKKDSLEPDEQAQLNTLKLFRSTLQRSRTELDGISSTAVSIGDITE